jgi:hypothetical protein
MFLRPLLFAAVSVIQSGDSPNVLRPVCRHVRDSKATLNEFPVWEVNPEPSLRQWADVTRYYHKKRSDEKLQYANVREALVTFGCNAF